MALFKEDIGDNTALKASPTPAPVYTGPAQQPYIPSYYTEEPKLTGNTKGLSADDIVKQLDANKGRVGLSTPQEEVSTATLQAGKRYDEYRPNVDFEDIYGQNQSGLKQIGNGLVKMGATALGTFAQSFFTIPNTISAIKNGKLSDLSGDPEGFEGSIDTWLKNIEDKFPNYYTKYEREHPFRAAIPFTQGSANFWGDQVIKNIGFTIGAIGGALAQDALVGLATEGIGDIPLVSSQVGKAALWINKLFAGTNDIEKLLETAKVAGATGEQLLNMKRLGELAQFTKVTNGIRYGMNIYGSSRTEAAIEARDGYRQVKDELIKQYQLEHGNQYPTGEEITDIEDYATNSMNTRFGINMALLTVSNAVQFDNLFRVFGKASTKGVGASVVKDIEEAGKIGLKEGSLNEFEIKAPASFIGKAWDVIKPKLPMLFSEGVYEEGGQYAAERGTYDYYTRKYKNLNNPSYKQNWDTLNEAIKSTQYGFEEEFGTTPGLQNIFLGALTALITGGGMQAMDRIKGQGKDARLQYALNTVNQYGLTGILSNKYDDTLNSIGIAKEMKEAANSGDIFKYKNLQDDMFFNFVNSRIPSGMHDVTIEQLNMLKDLPKEDFEKTFGMDFNETNKSTVGEYVDTLINSANTIKDTIDTLDRTYKNPFNFTLKPTTDEERKESLNHNIFNQWKTDIARYATLIPNRNNRLASIEQEVMKTNPLLNNDVLAQLTNNESLKELANEYSIEADRLGKTIIDTTPPQDKNNIKNQIKTLRTYSERIHLMLDGKENTHKTFTQLLNFELNLRDNTKQDQISPEKSIDLSKYGVDINRTNNMKEGVSKILDGLTSKEGFEKYFQQADDIANQKTPVTEAKPETSVTAIAPKFKNKKGAEETIQEGREYETPKINASIVKKVGDKYQVITPDGKVYLGKAYDTRQEAISVAQEINTDLGDLSHVKVLGINPDGTIKVEDIAGNIQNIDPKLLAGYERIETEQERIIKEKESLDKEQDNLETDSSTIATIPPTEKEFTEESKIKDAWKFFSSGITEFEEDNGDIIPSQHITRSRIFLNNLKNFKNKDNIYAILVTPNQQEKLGLTGLTKLSYGTNDSSNANDVYKGLVVQIYIEVIKGKVYFIDEEGKRISEVGKSADMNRIVFQTMPTPKLTRKDRNTGEEVPRYRKDQEEDFKVLSKAWEEKRKELFEAPAFPLKPYRFTISRGIPIINDKINGLYERNHVGDLLIPEEKIGTQQGLIQVVTKGAIAHQGQSIKFTNGLTVFHYEDTLGFLSNSRFTKEKATTIYQVIKAMAAEIADKKTINYNYYNFLQNVLYWKRKDNVTTGNQIYVDTSTGEIFLGGKRYAIPEIAAKEEEIIEQLQNEKTFHNINNKTLETKFDKTFVEYTLGKDGELTTIEWDNYQTYLLAAKHPDGSSRGANDTPLVTAVAKPTDAIPYSFKQKYATLEAFELSVIQTPKPEVKVAPEVSNVAEIKGYKLGVPQVYKVNSGPVDFTATIDNEGKLGVVVRPNTTTKTISQNDGLMNGIISFLVNKHGQEVVDAITGEEEGKVIQFLADKIHSDLFEAQKETKPSVPITKEKIDRINEIEKSELKLTLLTAKQLTSDPNKAVAVKEAHDAIKDRYKKLQDLINCI